MNDFFRKIIHKKDTYVFSSFYSCEKYVEHLNIAGAFHSIVAVELSDCFLISFRCLLRFLRCCSKKKKGSRCAMSISCRNCRIVGTRLGGNSVVRGGCFFVM